VSFKGKRSVQGQFGSNAAAYATSDVHAKGTSLRRLVELTQPQPNWNVLDLASGPGHTAHVFAPIVSQVAALDLSPEMLLKLEELGTARGISNELPVIGAVDFLPFPQRYFNLVTCRLAAHHFPDTGRFMAEVFRVLRTDGLLGLVDNVVLGSKRSGKLAAIQNNAGRYINAFDKLRDPSHERAMTVEEWRQNHYEAGFRIIHEEVYAKTIDFSDWVARMNVNEHDITRLKAMLLKAPDAVGDDRNPKHDGNRVTFDLHEAIFISKKESADRA